jgi:hypothetical protein
VGLAAVRCAADIARTRFGARFLRCDAIAEHPLLRRFYYKAGFEARGSPPILALKNPFAGGEKTAPGPPGRPCYTVNAAAPPTAAPEAFFTCQAYELALESA